jgi:hypothetical protein
MSLSFDRLPALAAALTLAAALPLSAFAASGHSASPSTPKTLQLPAASPSGSTVPVISFGPKGGSLRPWSVSFNLDGTIAATGTQPATTALIKPKDTLKGLLVLANAEGFFSMPREFGCKGSGAAGPDASAQTITIHTAATSKTVSAYGLCKGKFNQLYFVLQQVAGLPH